MNKIDLSSTPLRLNLVTSICLALTACGGGGNSADSITSHSTTVSAQASLVPPSNVATAFFCSKFISGLTSGVTSVAPNMSSCAPEVVAATSCVNGGINNPVGADDPFAVNAWHLKNTGPTQVISAFSNAGVAGIDANVAALHQGGSGCTGKGVSIAIVDSGMEIGHEDLSPNVAPNLSFNFGNNSSDPSPAPNQTSLDHGTGVAGVAAARGWNGLGSRGTAPFAKLAGYAVVGVTPAAGTNSNDIMYLTFGARSLADQTQSVTTLFGTRADGMGVFNFSAGSDYAAPTTVSNFSSMELAAAFGTSNLRNGLGAIYLQAAGNEFQSMNGGLPNGTSLRVSCATTLAADAGVLGGTLANAGGLSCGSPNQEPAGKPYFYQIAALTNAGVASSYSSAGASVWISGFGGEFGTEAPAIITTDNSSCSSGTNNVANQPSLLAQWGTQISLLIADLFGAAGSKDPNCNYTGQMNGTSAATPSVAGVVATLLEANPKLTWQDVGYILAKTATKVDATATSGTTAVTFTPTGSSVARNLVDPWITNAAGFNFHNRYGFGMVNALAAAQLASIYKVPAGRRAAPIVATGSTSSSTFNNQTGLNVATANFASPSAVSGPIRLDLTLTNNTGASINPGFLQFEIVNTATGTKSIVMPAFSSWYVGGKEFPIASGGQQQFRFQTNAFLGESLGGDFQITVVDFSGNSGPTGKALAFQPTLTSFSM